MEEKEKTLEAINKKYKDKHTIFKLGDDLSHLDRDILPTFSLGLDYISAGGILRGILIEILGPESSGKSTLALHLMSVAQKVGEVAYIDLEHSFDPVYASKIGVDVPNLWFSQPSFAEQALEIIETLAETGTFSLVVLDSIAGLCPKTEVLGEPGESFMGLVARLMSQHLRKVTGIASRNKCTILYLNQLRSKIGVVYGNPEVTTGGNALKFWTTLRLDMRKIKILKNAEDTPYGISTKIKAIKNKAGIPFREIELEISGGNGFNLDKEIIELGAKYGVIEQKGSWYNYKEKRIGQGLNNVIEYLNSDEKIKAEIFVAIKEAIFGKNGK